MSSALSLEALIDLLTFQLSSYRGFEIVKDAFGLTDDDSNTMLLDSLYKIKMLVITQKVPVYNLCFGEIFCAYRFSGRIKHTNTLASFQIWAI